MPPTYLRGLAHPSNAGTPVTECLLCQDYIMSITESWTVSVASSGTTTWHHLFATINFITEEVYHLVGHLDTAQTNHYR
jgi:hypothetical protein